MLLSGDEFANSQCGNNNAYCQDNEISWLDWNLLETHRDLYDFVRRLIAFRKAHPVLRAESYDFSHNGTGYPELSFHGTLAWNLDEHDPGLSFGYMYAEDHERYGTEQDDGPCKGPDHLHPDLRDGDRGIKTGNKALCFFGGRALFLRFGGLKKGWPAWYNYMCSNYMRITAK
jgi:hypothetical protein